MALISSSPLIHKIKLLISLVLFFTTATKVTCRFSNETDRLALLSFKKLIAEDPLGSLSSWNNSLDLCEWDGVTCSRKHQRVVVLDLRGKSLSGTVSPFLGNLSFLRSLYLQNNTFQGKIPLELGHLFRLQHLNLRSNSLQGEIPTNLPKNLRNISLPYNDLVGKIPASIGSLSKLTSLVLYSNHLIGGIPPSLGNLSLLLELDLGQNSITGTIPHSISLLSNLQRFGISGNRLSGTVPPPLYNISTLTYLFTAENQLIGSLPQDIGLTLPNLERFVIWSNQFWGPIPVSISNASRMELLDISENNLSGLVSFDLGRKMKDLMWLDLGDNYLGSGDASDLMFIDSLTNCTKLQKLGFYDNGFGGVLPPSIANLSSNLIQLSARGNRLVGSIPVGISNLVNLTDFSLEQNIFSGVIPFEIGKLRNVQRLFFSRNNLSGPIPASIGNLTRIFDLYLDNNNLNGTIPSSIENMLGLQTLDLSHNLFTGPIPKIVGLFSTLTFLILSHNSFMGALPLEIGKLNNLQELDVSDNKLSGPIPNTLGNCLRLESLYLQGNMFQGSIPPSFSSLKGIQILDLSCNNLSGQIEEDLAALLFLKNLNLSFNNLAGEVPSHGVFGNLSAISLVGNKGLCGGIPEIQLPACPNYTKKGNRHGFKIIVPIACLIMCLALVVLLVVFEYLPNGSLENWLHPREHTPHQEGNLSLAQRLNIAIDVAWALEYLHHYCETPIVHGDLKPSNILLDEDMTAYVGDFGLAKFLTQNSSNSDVSSLAIKGSIGYVAPEYGIAGRTSKEGDVYSYGILLLEMLTGKRPIYESFTNGQSLHEFCMLALPERVMEILDSHMLLAESTEVEHDAQNERVRKAKIRECLISLVRIGIACSEESPSERMNIKDVIIRLTTIKEVFLGVGIHGRRQPRMPLAGEGTSGGIDLAKDAWKL